METRAAEGGAGAATHLGQLSFTWSLTQPGTGWVVPGGFGHHFYLNDHLPELVGDIERKISSLCRS
jgi:hypothetical protein